MNQSIHPPQTLFVVDVWCGPCEIQCGVAHLDNDMLLLAGFCLLQQGQGQELRPVQ